MIKETLEEIIETVRNRRTHFLIIDGNIYDILHVNAQEFPDLQSFLSDLTKLKFSRFLAYDIFSGLKVVSGDLDSVMVDSGLKNQQPKGPNAELITAMRQAKMAVTSDFPINPLELFPLLNQLLLKAGKPTVLLINHPDVLVPQSLGNFNDQVQRVLSVAFTDWSRNLKIRENGHLIILLANNAEDIQSKIRDRSFQTQRFRVLKPNEEERYIFLKDKNVDIDSLSVLSKITAGLSCVELLDTFQKCKSMPPEKMIDSVFTAKQKILQDNYSDVLEILRTKNGFEAIGGLEKPIAKMRWIANCMKEGKTSLVPQGVLLMGPPGTGKTVLAEAFAKEAGINFVKPLDIKSMWVGESERRMSRFLNTIKDLAPVAVFIDEFDQNQGQRGGFDGDSGVSRSLFKKMLEIMSDTSLRGKVLWLLATNRPDLIDPAMKRPGRCDLRIPFLPPDERQLALICESAFKQYPDMQTEIAEWRLYASRCAGYSGADMIEVIRRAWEHANESGRSRITEKDMDWACQDYRPQVVDKVQAAKMTLRALLECSSESLLPENWKDVVRDCLQVLGISVPDDFDQSDHPLSSVNPLLN